MGGAGAGGGGCGCRPSPHHGGNGGGGHVPRGVPTALGVRVPAGGGQRARTPTPFTCGVVQPKPFLRNDSWRQCTPTAAAWRASSVHEPVALPRASPRACVHARAYRCERIRRRELRGGCKCKRAPDLFGPICASGVRSGAPFAPFAPLATEIATPRAARASEQVTGGRSGPRSAGSDHSVAAAKVARGKAAAPSYVAPGLAVVVA